MGWLIDTSLWIAVERGTFSAVFGQLAGRIRKAGKDPHVRVNDLWRAAQAIERDFRLLTSNAKDFSDIPGLRMTVVKLP